MTDQQQPSTNTTTEESSPSTAVVNYVTQVDIIRHDKIVASETRKPSDSTPEFAKKVERAITSHHAEAVDLTWYCEENGPKWASQVRNFIKRTSAT